MVTRPCHIVRILLLAYLILSLLYYAEHILWNVSVKETLLRKDERKVMMLWLEQAKLLMLKD